MILKYLDTNNNWNWVNDVDEISYLGQIPIGQLAMMEADVYRDLYESDEPSVIRFTKGGYTTLLCADIKQAFLVNDHGTTIDVLVRG